LTEIYRLGLAVRVSANFQIFAVTKVRGGKRNFLGAECPGEYVRGGKCPTLVCEIVRRLIMTSKTSNSLNYDSRLSSRILSCREFEENKQPELIPLATETSPRLPRREKRSEETPVCRLGSGPRLVGRIGSGVRVSASFQVYKNVATLRGGYLWERFSLGGGSNIRGMNANLASVINPLDSKGNYSATWVQWSSGRVSDS